jgi:hypothetical protein
VKQAGPHTEARRDEGEDADTLLFLAAATVVSTVIGYRFGFGNQTEQFPLVLRYLDPGYLTRDFFVETGSAFGPRFYYAKTLALLCHLAPLPMVVFALVLAVNAGIAFVTYRAAREVLREGRLTGWVAAVLALSVASFQLGAVTDIRFMDFQPGSMAIPWALASLWMALTGKPVKAGAFASFASVWHPLYGVETGALALLAAAAHAVLSLEGERTKAAWLRALRGPVLGGVVLGVSVFVLWALPGLGEKHEELTTAEVIHILARFRAPHHYGPSTFPRKEYLAFLAFTAAAALAFHGFWSDAGRRRRDLAFLAPPLAISLACACGYLFVEVWPTGAAATAQPFRMMYAYKWLGFLVVARLIAGYIQARDVGSRLLGFTAFLATGTAHPTVLLITAVASPARALLGTHFSPLQGVLVPAIAALASLVLMVRSGTLRETLLVGTGATLAALFTFTRRRSARLLGTALATSLVLAALLNRSARLTREKAFSPILTADDDRSDEADAERWVREHIRSDAVFVTPPGLGSFRLIAHRAVVVDFKSVPFGAAAMRQWYERIMRLYGPAPGGGFAALDRMDRNYAAITDGRLAEAAERYGASYALLYAATPTSRTPLYGNGTFKVVEL